MPKRNNEYIRQEIDIADFIYDNPAKNREDVLSHFVVFFQRNRRTIERYYKKALEYNKTRLHKEEEIKEEIRIEKKKEAVISGILSRNEALKILSDIANGVSRSVGDEGGMMVPTDSDRTRAIQTLAKFEGWEATKEININNNFLDLMVAASKNKTQ